MNVSRTVVCLKWGDMYGPEYVNRLFAMVSRNVDSPVRFVCFTEDATGLRDDIEIKALPDFPDPPTNMLAIVLLGVSSPCLMPPS